MTSMAIVFPAETVKAEALMSKPLVTLRNSDTMRRAAAVLLDENISGAPVLNHLDQPVGVLTKTDIVRYEREYVAAYELIEGREAMRTLGTLEIIARSSGFHKESEEDYVSHWMTPKVFAVAPEASLAEVLAEMSQKKIHRVFVKDGKSLVGVITTFDLMRFLAKICSVKSDSPKKSGKE